MFADIITLAAAILLVIAVLALIFVVTSCFRDLYEKAENAEFSNDLRRKGISELWTVFRGLREEFDESQNDADETEMPEPDETQE